MKKSRILIVGFGSIGKKHHKILAKNFKKYDLLIHSKHLNKKVNFSNFMEKDIKNVLICNPSTQHIHSINKILKLNQKINVFVEKPLSYKPIKINEINRIKDFIKKKNIIFQIGYCLRYHQITKFLKKFINKNKKKILEASFNTRSNILNWREGNYKKHVSSNNKLGGGVLNELSHELDLLVHLFGKPKKLLSNVYNSKLFNIDVEDTADIFYKYDKRFNIQMHLDFNSSFERRVLEIKTKNNYLIADFVNNKISFLKGKKILTKRFKMKKNMVYNYQLKDFLEKKGSSKLSIKNLEESNFIVNLISYIKKSSKKNKIVKVF